MWKGYVFLENANDFWSKANLMENRDFSPEIQTQYLNRNVDWRLTQESP